MIRIIKEIDRFGGKLYIRQGLESDVIELKATYKNLGKSKKFNTGDLYRSIDTGNIYEFEEGSNQWYLHDLATVTSSEITDWFRIY